MADSEAAWGLWKESIDRPATSLEDDIESALKDLKSDGELLEVSCRQELCRVQMRFGSIRDAHNFKEALSDTEQLKHIRTSDDDGALLADVMIAKPEFSEPTRP